MNAVNILFSHRIKALRLKAKVSQKELATMMGLSESAISMMERGLRMPSIETLWTLADYFNVSMDYLMGRFDEPCTEKINSNCILISKCMEIENSKKHNPTEKKK